MLSVQNISTGYGKKQVLFDVSFTVGDSEIVLLTGGKKRKKSTVLKCIYGILPKWNKDAQVFFNGKDITNRPTSEMVKQGIVYIPQKDNYFESLTVHENLVVSGSAYTGDVVKQRINEVYQLPHLKEYSNRTPFNLSGGERQLLALGNALMHKPKLILFDEPFAGLDDANTKIIVDELLKLKEQKIGMLIVEHKLIFDKFADKVLKMELGKIFNENKLF